MKRLMQTLLLVLFAGGLNAAGHATEAGVPLTEGLVRKVDKSAAKLTLTHGPLPNGMAGMTMAFKVREPARLEGLKEGQKVLFAVDDALSIVRLEAAKSK